MNFEYFDLPELQQEVREAQSTRSLFVLWDKVCRFYDRGTITKHELEEMRDIIWPRMQHLASIQKMIDGCQTCNQRKLAS